MDAEYLALAITNVRGQPTTGSAKVGVLAKGTTVTVTGRTRVAGATWYRVVGLGKTLPLSFALSGRVEQVSAKPGGTVRQGELLARLYSPEADVSLETAAAGVAAARAGLAAQEREVATMEKLVADKLVSRAQRDQAVVALARARQEMAAANAKLAAARAMAEGKTLIAPIAGTVIERAVEPGMYVRAGAPVLVVREAGAGEGYVLGRLLREPRVAAVVPPKPVVPSPSKPVVGVFAKRPGETFKDCAECPEMVVVPAGSFRMGDLSGGGSEDEKPVHGVTIPRPFALGKYEMTFAEWGACVADGGCNGYRPGDEGWGRGRRPVINLSWGDAKTYADWLSGLTGKPYRLPSEAEWEYAARAGTTTKYAFGDAISPGQANFGNNQGKTVSVGRHAANAFGLHDMHGNVWEWVEDCWHGSYAGSPKDGSAWTSGGNCQRRVLRGDSWLNNPRYLRAANRSRSTSDGRSNLYGFRIARTLSR